MELQALLNKESFPREDVVRLLNLDSKVDISLLYEKARQVKEKSLSEGTTLRGVIDISNSCTQNCLSCYRRTGNTLLKRYRMPLEEIISTAQKVSNQGIRTIVLKSGEDTEMNADEISYIIYSIRQATNLSISLSLGQRDFEDYKVWRYSGAERYIMRYETSNEELFYQYHSHKRLKDRIRHIQYLKSLGYQIGSGSIIGLPGQTINDIAGDILLNIQLNADLVSFSPFIPLEGTPMQHLHHGSLEMTYKCMAVSRLVMSNKQISSSRALSLLDLRAKENSLAAGANVLLTDFTPQKYRDVSLMYKAELDGTK